MDGRTQPVSDSGWICNRCGVPVEVETVRLQYRRTIFALHLPACPECGMILVDEALAVGKMAEAEQILEDK
jgi:NAD-dependent SIR2 family protein deacetylase